MRAGPRSLTPESQQWLREALLADQLCGSELTSGLCAICDWVNPMGAPCAPLGVCRPICSLAVRTGSLRLSTGKNCTVFWISAIFRRLRRSPAKVVEGRWQMRGSLRARGKAVSSHWKKEKPSVKPRALLS